MCLRIPQGQADSDKAAAHGFIGEIYELVKKATKRGESRINSKSQDKKHVSVGSKGVKEAICGRFSNIHRQGMPPQGILILTWRALAGTGALKLRSLTCDMPDVPTKSVFGTNRVLPLPGTTGEVDADEHDSANQVEQSPKLLALSSSLGESVLGTHAEFSPAIEHLKVVPAKIKSTSASGASR
ncbi:hypothetical protein llap_17379 [Limosa lapponica baueri]|uniref:Uncharacterized protein n=1 Tax=Limosa lapponica baueri TaxID=1758121 RepID=A0A2I0TEV6_LIMLA|nr:hypothetical protein llap_17379 [Limosa lapponica baueri]